MKNKKIIIIFLTIILLIIAITTLIIFITSKQDEENAKQSLTEFISLINDKNYDAMYEKVILSNIDKNTFVTRNKNIYEGIDAENIKVEINKIEKDDKKYQIYYEQEMVTSAGNLKFSNNIAVEKENEEYKLEWTSSFIIPNLKETDKVRVYKLKGKRGEILDRNDVKLASNGSIASVGIVPRKIRRK